MVRHVVALTSHRKREAVVESKLLGKEEVAPTEARRAEEVALDIPVLAERRIVGLAATDPATPAKLLTGAAQRAVSGSTT